MPITAITPDLTPARPTAGRTTALLLAALFAILLVSRLCHSDILWADEDYHQAAAIQALHGKVPYRDFWYDKPPLNIAVYLLFGASSGGVLRIASAVYAWLICWSAFYFAKRQWSRTEGHIAASLAAFFLIFYFPAATITLEPDTLLILPHLWAVYFAWQRRPFAAGLLAGVAMLFNVKAIFVLAACVSLEWTAITCLTLGFAIPNALALTWLASQGALAGYGEQVWQWGLLYAGSSASIGSGFAGLARLANWSAFHAALILAATWCWGREPDSETWPRNRMRWIGWTLISLGASAVGWSFAPRYLDQLLPPLILAASRGFVLVNAEKRRMLQAVLAIALLIPAIRFGPRYATLAAETLRGEPHAWTDTAMDQDSRAAARIISRLATKDSTLFVWGYRPNIFVYTRLAAASRFSDSQPLTGVPADRHLSDDRPILNDSAADSAADHRAELARSRPDFIADGLSLYNPRLDIHRYPDLALWFAQYYEVARTPGTVIYRRRDAR